MTEKEYFAQIKDIRRHISAGRLEYADELLTKMYAYKPVRLLWFVAKAEYVLAKEDDPAAALKVLDGEQCQEKKFFLGEDYPGLKACMKFRIEMFRRMGRERDAVREEYCYQRACGKRGSRLEEALAAAVEAFAEDSENTQALCALGDAFYHTADMVSYFIVHIAMLRQGLLQEDGRNEWFYQIPNFGYLEERLCAEEPNTVILIMDEHLEQTLEVLGFLLHSLGHKVYLLSPPLVFETEEQLELGDTLQISLDNMEQYPDMCVIPPVALTKEGIPYGDNRDHIIDHICRNESGNDQALLLCSGVLLDALYRDGPLRGRLGKLSSCDYLSSFYNGDYQEEKLQFGWSGSYLSYISNIYRYDVQSDIKVKPEVEFSIVIPVRNSAATLQSTLQTCFHQRYTGSYEIVVSDNSIEGNTEVYNLCQEIKDPRIRYVKTPRSLQLAKSFEFAYLQTRGAFILPIGADDGILPWTLETLKRVLDQFPQDEIIQWDRGFYAWPGFNGGQENMFQIPQKYEKGKINICYDKTSDLLNMLAQDRQAIYVMPLIYINSGFRRRYLQTLLNKTGKLWDGSNQDMQIGIINCCINHRILRLSYPLTIAGMSSLSVGYLSSSIEKETAHQQILQQTNMGVTIPTERERCIIPSGLDSSSLYVVLARAVTEGILLSELADKILDWKTAVLQTFQAFSTEQENYDRFLHMQKFMAKRVNQELSKWFESSIYKSVVIPRPAKDEHQRQSQKSYKEERNALGGETLDASKYGVHNIAEAVKLFEKKTGL